MEWSEGESVLHTLPDAQTHAKKKKTNKSNLQGFTAEWGVRRAEGLGVLSNCAPGEDAHRGQITSY